MRICIVTSNDYWLAPLVAAQIRADGHECRIIDVRLPVRNDFSKRLKLAAIFGPVAVLRILLTSRTNRRAAISIERMAITAVVERAKVTSEVVMLMNFPQKFPVLSRPIYNFHPSLLPSYRGLMSLPRITLDKLRGRWPAIYGVTIHEIAESFDTGRIAWREFLRSQDPSTNLAVLYELAYTMAARGIISAAAGAPLTYVEELDPSDSRPFTWREVAALKLRTWIEKLWPSKRWAVYTSS